MRELGRLWAVGGGGGLGVVGGEVGCSLSLCFIYLKFTKYVNCDLSHLWQQYI